MSYPLVIHALVTPEVLGTLAEPCEAEGANQQEYFLCLWQIVVASVPYHEPELPIVRSHRIYVAN